MKNNYIYCLELVEDVEIVKKSVVLTSLENLALQYGITSVYKTCDSIDTFEESLSTLLYEDKHFNDYAVIYLVVKGRENQIVMGNYCFSFEEIAELFEGKLQDKIIHFANLFQLELEEETFQYFLDVTGAKAISGYCNCVPIVSTMLDNLYFSIYEQSDTIFETVETLFDKQYNLCTTLGFRMYY
ncbi:DUF6642 family protein [Flavobacterium sp.]|uniref:DUF6642 family protein n=1 Tax=Flavobacterium sp. TaxID=239 RepID=UPI003526CE65